MLRGGDALQTVVYVCERKPRGYDRRLKGSGKPKISAAKYGAFSVTRS